MLYFSKLKLVTIYSIILFLSFFSFTNFVEEKDNFFLSKKVNLGLDLLGGSYLLLEVDIQPVVVQNLQNKLIFLRKELKKLNIKYKNLKVKNATIIFQISKNQVKKFEDFFLNKVNPINVYFDQYKSYEMDYSITDLGELFPAEDKITISYSKFGLIEIKNSALDHSLEIVRRRIDEVGTKEPTIIKRGNNRILIELPGLDDPNRIKNLLGKTANLTFRLVSEKDDDFGSEDLFLDDGKGQLRVNKRVMVSGDNLVNAIPKFDSNSNQATVSFTLDRVGAKRFGKVTSQNVGKRLAIILDNKIISAPQFRNRYWVVMDRLLEILPFNRQQI